VIPHNNTIPYLLLYKPTSSLPRDASSNLFSSTFQTLSSRSQTLHSPHLTLKHIQTSPQHSCLARAASHNTTFLTLRRHTQHASPADSGILCAYLRVQTSRTSYPSCASSDCGVAPQLRCTAPCEHDVTVRLERCDRLRMVF
jgi:hypothetical protein